MAENYYPATYRNASGNALAFSTTADRVFDNGVSVASEISALQTGKATVAQGDKADAALPANALKSPTLLGTLSTASSTMTINDNYTSHVGYLLVVNQSGNYFSSFFPSSLIQIGGYYQTRVYWDSTTGTLSAYFKPSSTSSVVLGNGTSIECSYLYAID